MQTKTAVTLKDSQLNLNTGLSLITSAKMRAWENTVMYAARAEQADELGSHANAERWRKMASDAKVDMEAAEELYDLMRPILLKRDVDRERAEEQERQGCRMCSYELAGGDSCPEHNPNDH